mgnify:CR=1 FL=1
MGRTGRIPKSIESRFWTKVDKQGPNDCWNWKASTSNGYGRIWQGGRGGGWILAHRFAYEYANGAFDSKLLVCHHCDNPRCCNPNHMFLGTWADNTHDMILKGRGIGKGIGSRRNIHRTINQSRIVNLHFDSLRQMDNNDVADLVSKMSKRFVK